MVDLETWGTTPGCDIRSIGAVVFDPETGELGDEFYVNVSGGGGYGLTRDPATEQWWSEQSNDAQKRLDVGIRFLGDGLTSFYAWFLSHGQPFHPTDYTRLWAHGPHFDEAILAAANRAAAVCSIPWHYRAPRDCRTIWDAVGGVDIPMEGVEHDALVDAKHQARCVIEAYRRLRNDPLRKAALDLYMAGRWSCDRSVDEVRLWTALRDALNLQPGTATAAGVAA
jgi:hypothetical protein